MNREMIAIISESLKFIRINKYAIFLFCAIIVFIDIIFLKYNTFTLLGFLIKIFIYIYFLNIISDLIFRKNKTISWFHYHKLGKNLIFEIFATIFALYALMEIALLFISFVLSFTVSGGIKSIIEQYFLFFKIFSFAVYFIILFYLLCVSSIIFAFRCNYLDAIFTGVKLMYRIKILILIPLFGYFFSYLLTIFDASKIAILFFKGFVAFINLWTCIIIFHYFTYYNYQKVQEIP